MIPTETRQLLDHMEWADALAWSVVAGLDAAAEDDRVAYLLHHTHTVQWVYLNLWRDEALNMPELATFSDLDAVRAWGREYYAELAGFLDGLADGDLDATIHFPWAEQLAERFGKVQPTSMRQALLQVPMHSHYHRGQLATRIRELGGEPPLTDFVAWTWAGRPGARWPGEEG